MYFLYPVLNATVITSDLLHPLDNQGIYRLIFNIA